jgi:ketosteroid isomerase-like protein
VCIHSITMISFISAFISILFSSPYSEKVSDKETVMKADKELNLMIMQHDASKAATFYADEFVLTTSSGNVKLKKDMLADIASANLVLEINETTGVTVRVIENTAVLTGILHQKGIYNNKPFDVKLNVTDTWVKTGKHWKILAGHATLLP